MYAICVCVCVFFDIADVMKVAQWTDVLVRHFRAEYQLTVTLNGRIGPFQPFGAGHPRLPDTRHLCPYLAIFRFNWSAQ